MTESIRISWAVDRLCIQQCRVHETLSPRSSIVMSVNNIFKSLVYSFYSAKYLLKSNAPKWLLSALWYIASCSALFWALLKTGSPPSLWFARLSAVFCCTVPELPSASISSSDSTSFSPLLAEKFSGCESNWCKQPLCPCAVATDIALKYSKILFYNNSIFIERIKIVLKYL